MSTRIDRKDIRISKTEKTVFAPRNSPPMTNINSNDIRINNTKKIIFALRNSPPITKRELAESLRLSLPTIASIVKDLEESGYILDCGRTDSAVGRKPSLISLNYEACYMVGVRIATHSLDIAVLNFGGEIVARNELLKAFSGTESYWREISEEIDRLIDESGTDKNKVNGIRIAVPYILYPQFWANAKLKSKPKNMISLAEVPTCFSYETDLVEVAIAAGVPRYWYGKLDKDAAVIFLSRYIEGCILRKDPITGGISAQACQIGHMSLNYRGRDCFCGKNGCFQEYCSTSLIIDKINGLDTSHDVIGRLPKKKIKNWDEFFADLEAGNREYAELWDHYLDMLAYAIHNVKILLRSDIIISGEISEFIARYKHVLVKKIGAFSIEEETDIDEYLHTNALSRYDACIGAALSRIDSLVETI